ncbi:hypothetical protein J1614_003796 [Plenodomus biglobosus]|nr:hypothetical protein J1614_003796 [Plenodomus biglobosus]
MPLTKTITLLRDSNIVSWQLKTKARQLHHQTSKGHVDANEVGRHSPGPAASHAMAQVVQTSGGPQEIGMASKKRPPE